MKSLLGVAILLAGCSVDLTPTLPAKVKKVEVKRTTVLKAESSSSVSVDLVWNPNLEANISGYHVHYGTAPHVYDAHPDNGNVTHATISNLQPGTRYYFSVSAYDDRYFESAMSDEIEWISESPTPTPTVTPTPTPSVTPSPTVTPTPTISPTPTPGSLLNISTRAFVQSGDNILIAGFIVKDRPVHILVRAIGPSLSVFFPVTLANPFLELRGSTGALIDENDDWKDDAEAEIFATGLAPRNDRESAISRIVPPGSYTAIVRGVNNGTGVALVEVYALP